MSVLSFAYVCIYTYHISRHFPSLLNLVSKELESESNLSYHLQYMYQSCFESHQVRLAFRETERERELCNAISLCIFCDV